MAVFSNFALKPGAVSDNSDNCKNSSNRESCFDLPGESVYEGKEYLREDIFQSFNS